MFKKTAVALSVVTLATGAAALPEAQARDYTSVQVASCAANPCNPCAAAACNPCNPSPDAPGVGAFKPLCPGVSLEEAPAESEHLSTGAFLRPAWYKSAS